MVIHILIIKFLFDVIMVEYVKTVNIKDEEQKEYYHWHTECPDFPLKERESVLIFKVEPLHLTPCPKCIELDKASRK